MKIKVTQEHIDRSLNGLKTAGMFIGGICASCPTALAISEALGQECLVGYTMYQKDSDRKWRLIKDPDSRLKVFAFTQKFTNRNTRNLVEPYEFEISDEDPFDEQLDSSGV